MKPRRLWVAFLFSLVVPGLGQMHAGYFWRGICWWLAVGTLTIMLASVYRLGPLAPGIPLLLLVLGAIDAVLVLRRDQRRNAERPRLRQRTYFAYFAGIAALGIGLAGVTPKWRRAETFNVPTVSGLPSLKIGDFFVTSMMLGPKKELRRGEIIVYFHNKTLDIYFHRLVGLPGDVITMTADGHLSLNGAPLSAVPAGPYDAGHDADGDTAPLSLFRETLPNEDGAEASYLILRDPQRNLYPDITIQVPDGHVFVLGDNRDRSADSRMEGPVRIDRVIGKASFILWPGEGQSGERDWSRIGRSLLPE